MRKLIALATACIAALAGPAAAQLGVPGLSLPGIQVPAVEVPQVPIEQTIETATGMMNQTAQHLLDLRTERIDRLVRRNRNAIELDARGEPARRGVLLLIEPTDTTLDAAEQAGFTVMVHDQLSSLGLTVIELRLPRGTSLARGEALLAKVAPGAQIAPDNLNFQSGSAPPLILAAGAVIAAKRISTPVGIVDGAPAADLGVGTVKGFAKGAPAPSDHASEVASLLEEAGASNLLAADIYGTDPAGGNALALVRSLDWLTGKGAKVISLSLTGPRNKLVGRAVAAAQRKGVVLVAAAGNDGPAAPPAYPASYSGVLAVTAVDKHLHVLIEAGRPLHLDYAAPGADIRGENRAGKWIEVRGTSFAVPLVAARAAAALERGGSWRDRLDTEAEDLGPDGPDAQYGRGLLCRRCARR